MKLPDRVGEMPAPEPEPVQEEPAPAPHRDHEIPDVAIEISARVSKLLRAGEFIEDLTVTDDLGTAKIELLLRYFEGDATPREIRREVEAMTIEWAWGRLRGFLTRR